MQTYNGLNLDWSNMLTLQVFKFYFNDEVAFHVTIPKEKGSLTFCLYTFYISLCIPPYPFPGRSSI